MTELEKLEIEISEQREENIRLYSAIQYRLHEECMQPLVEEWREGSRNLRELIARKNLLLSKEVRDEIDFDQMLEAIHGSLISYSYAYDGTVQIKEPSYVISQKDMIKLLNYVRSIN